MDNEREKISTILSSFREIIELLFRRIDLVEMDIKQIKKKQQDILLTLEKIDNTLSSLPSRRSIFSRMTSYILPEKKPKKQDGYMGKYLEFLKENPDKMILTTKEDIGDK